MRLNIVHETTYRYAQQVGFNPHRLMLRPRGGPDVQVLAHHLRCRPPAEVTWSQDVFGNLIATAQFGERAAEAGDHQPARRRGHGRSLAGVSGPAAGAGPDPRRHRTMQCASHAGRRQLCRRAGRPDRHGRRGDDLDSLTWRTPRSQLEVTSSLSGTPPSSTVTPRNRIDPPAKLMSETPRVRSRFSRLASP